MARHIAILCDSYPPEVRSAATLMGEVARGLRDRGWEVTVLTIGPGRGPANGDGVHVVRVPSLPLHDVPAWRKGLAWLALPAVVAGAGALLVRRPDVLWVYSPPLTFGLAAAVLKRRFRCRLVLHVQDLFPDNAVDLGLLRDPVLTRSWRLVEDVCYRAADRVVVHSAGHVPWLRRHAAFAGRPDAIAVVPNFVDVEGVQAAPPDADLKPRIGLQGRFVFVFGGVMGFAQDLDTVVEAARLLGDRPDLAFLLVGDGVAREAAQRRAAGLRLVVFHDWVPPREFARWLRACDAGLVTLRPEMTTPVVPSKTLTFLAAGLPVVAAVPRTSDTRDLVLQARCGVWVPAGDARALAAACATLASDPASARAMGERGLAACRDGFSREAGLDGVCRVLEAVLAPSAGGERTP